MNNLEQMVERHVREYESRLRHMDELLERVEKIDAAPARTELADLLKRRDELAVHLDDMKLKSVDDWAEEELAMAGPMAIWDAVAQRLETLVERFER